MAKRNSKAKQLNNKTAENPVVTPVTPVAPSVPAKEAPTPPVVVATPPTASERRAWFSEQFGLSAIIKVTLTLGILGFIPGAWMVGLPILTVYGLIKRETVAQAIRRFFRFRKELDKPDLAATGGEKIADFLITYYAGILRWFATLMLFFTMPIGFGIFAAYGLFRFTTTEWLEIFQQRCMDIYNFVISSANRFLRDASFNAKLILGTTVSILIGSSILLSGPLVLFAYSISVCQLAAVLVGGTAAARDLMYALRNPGIAFTQNSGKIAGTFWGRWLAYRIFPGQIMGSMGPAMGHVQSYGLFSGIASSFFAPEGWFIFNSGGVLGVLLSRFMTFFNSIFTNIFVSESIQMQGDFYGVIGPSPLQLIGMMLVGCFVGYAVEKFVDSLYAEVKEDGKKVANATVQGAKVVNNRLLDGLYKTRWALGFIAGTTPLLVTHATTGAALLELAGGSLFGASALAVAGLATSIGVIYGIGYGLKYMANKIMAKREAVLANQAAKPAVTDTKTAAPVTTKPQEAAKSPEVKAESFGKVTPAPIVTNFEKSKARGKAPVESANPSLRRSPRLQALK